MTAQIPETLRYQDEAVAMYSEPLASYLQMSGTRLDFSGRITALWRGYRGRWDVVAGRLYLVGLEGTLEDGSELTLEKLFPGYPERVFAHWYSGTIRIPQGRRLRYVHLGYASTFERDLFLDVDHGVVTGSRIRVNGEAPEGARLTKGPAAMTTWTTSNADRQDHLPSGEGERP